MKTKSMDMDVDVDVPAVAEFDAQTRFLDPTIAETEFTDSIFAELCQDSTYPCVVRFIDPEHGYGVFATRDFKAGDEIFCERTALSLSNRGLQAMLTSPSALTDATTGPLLREIADASQASMHQTDGQRYPPAVANAIDKLHAVYYHRVVENAKLVDPEVLSKLLTLHDAKVDNDIKRIFPTR